MSRGGGAGRGGRGGGRGGSFIVQSYKHLMRPDGAGPLFGGAEDASGEQLLYPQLPRRPAPPTVVKDLKFMVAAKRDLENRFCGCASRLLAVPNSTNFPAELDWLRRKRRRQIQNQQQAARTASKKANAANGEAKRRRQDVEDAAAVTLIEEAVDAGLKDAAGQLESATEASKEATAAAGGEAGDADDEEEDEEAAAFENDEELEDNDYVDAYFDNGEGYGPDDGEEDMDGESWYY